jgi:pyruvate formate lyase activating enzyme
MAFHGCPLSCKYCLNPSCLDSSSDKIQHKTSDEVINILKKDSLYFLATKGGVTFGGGEPLLHAEFMKEIIEKYDGHLDVTVETSLNVPRKSLEIILPYIQEFIVDIKDMNPQTYKAYTGKGNNIVKDNLEWLIQNGYANKIVCRIPLIPNYNDQDAQNKSMYELESMGITRFDKFNYIIKDKS